MFYRNQTKKGQSNKTTFGQKFKSLLKKNYLASIFIIATVAGGLLDYILGTMPKITCVAMVGSVFIGSCVQASKKNSKHYDPEKEKEIKGKTLL